MKNTVKFLSMMFAAGAMMFASCEPENVTPEPSTPQYTITVTANNDAYGTVTGGGTYDSAATATLTATPNEGYRFVNWSDGNESNPRLVNVTANATYTANFAEIAGVNVTFGTNTWTAGYTNGSMGSNAILLAATQSENPSSYPLFYLMCYFSGAPTTGTITDGPWMEEGDNNMVNIHFGQQAWLWYYESTSWDLSEQNRTGDWWAKSLTYNITALDADAMTMSAVVNAEMVHVTEMVNSDGYLTTIDFNDPALSTKSLTANIVNQTLTAAKGMNKVSTAVARMK
ncbi:MAG: hypothetical protein IJK84_06195 [Bacteroidales bacterium]|nr:hypothetical protein [Bacteroidales bacterium]